MDTIVSLCKRRGFVFPSAEIYGGFANAWDYGPLGAELKRIIRNAWCRGIVQIRKSFRNEITPGNFIFRTREFEQMELEFFVRPGEDLEWYDYWRHERLKWYIDLGVSPDNLRLYEYPQEELAHYSAGTTD